MESVLTILAISVLNIACFFVGSKVGRAIVKGEKVKMPNPVEAIKEHKAQKEAQKEAEWEQVRLETIMQNIECYDGTSNNQKDVPRG